VSKRPIFVISDLHIGDGSRGDSLEVADRGEQLDSFLEYTRRNKAELVIAGDLFELWRYRFDKVLERREGLLDKLDKMDCVYVTGNHDSEVVVDGDIKESHKFFQRARDNFVRTIGSKRIKFMHGHEVDPFVPKTKGLISKWLGACSVAFEFDSHSCAIHKDIVSDFFCEFGEFFLSFWEKGAGTVSEKSRRYYSMANDKFARLKRSLRTRRMLSRYHEDKKNGLYDVAVVGHTHKAGSFGSWYYNSGSWTGKSNNFMVINPDGSVEVFTWTNAGPVKNTTFIGC
jgi:UDP-2,3-diacylglucosamine pyrophosphatase LpxH